MVSRVTNSVKYDEALRIVLDGLKKQAYSVAQSISALPSVLKVASSIPVSCD